jgi:hypothetical protein
MRVAPDLGSGPFSASIEGHSMLAASSLARPRSAVRHRVSSTNVLMVTASVTGLLALGIAFLGVTMGFLG